MALNLKLGNLIERRAEENETDTKASIWRVCKMSFRITYEWNIDWLWLTKDTQADSTETPTHHYQSPNESLSHRIEQAKRP